VEIVRRDELVCEGYGRLEFEMTSRHLTSPSHHYYGRRRQCGFVPPDVHLETVRLSSPGAGSQGHVSSRDVCVLVNLRFGPGKLSSVLWFPVHEPLSVRL